jgi:PPOX class probable F420-dependent enzyme
MSESSPLSQLGNEPFVSLTTFRRSGEGVPTPVWVARDGDALIVLTPEESHKVGRVRRDPHVRLVPCTRTGRVKDGGPLVDGTAAVIADPADTERLRELIKRKYGAEYRVTMALERLFARRRKPRVILRITVPSGS